MFGQRELEQLINPPLARRTVSNTKLVFAYIRHGGCINTCLTCLLSLPKIASYGDEVIAACQPPFTRAKVACLREYSHCIEIPEALIEDMAYSLRFAPDIAEFTLLALSRIARNKSSLVSGQVLRCLYMPYTTTTRMAAAQTLVALSIQPEMLIPHVAALAELVRFGTSAVHLLSLIPEFAINALPELVNRGPTCSQSLQLVRKLAESYPERIVDSGAFKMLVLGNCEIPKELCALYDADCEKPTTMDQLLAYMHCRMALPEDSGHKLMKHVMHTQQAGVRALFANTYDLARHADSYVEPTAKSLDDFDKSLTGTIYLVAEDHTDTRLCVLAAPLARAAPYVAAHLRQSSSDEILVPLRSDQIESFFRALVYDDIPDENIETLRSFAIVANMWCAQRLTHKCVAVLAKCLPFWELYELVADWQDVRDLLRFWALEYLPDLAKEDKITELDDILWT